MEPEATNLFIYGTSKKKKNQGSEQDLVGEFVVRIFGRTKTPLTWKKKHFPENETQVSLNRICTLPRVIFSDIR